MKLPHISTYKRRWVRRLLIIIYMPNELIDATFRSWRDTLKGAGYWWAAP